ncbi:MAG: hypothetical protein ACOCP8_03170 [archaeon]
MESDRYQWAKSEINYHNERDLLNLIITCVGKYKGENFKKGISIRELIDYKNEKENEAYRLQLYVTAIDDIVNGIKQMYPYIDLTGIDLSWTTNEIVKYVEVAYNNPPIMTLNDIKKLVKKNEC